MNWLRMVSSTSNIHNIPGTKYDTVRQSLVGPVDAIAVLAQRLGKKIPEPPQYPPLMNDKWLTPLREYQVDGVSWVKHHLELDGSALLADDMGLGKTAQAITSWLIMGMPSPLLVVCPGSVRETWKRQLNKWAKLDPYLVTGKASWENQKASTAQVLVSSYEMAKQVPEWLYPQFLIIDEAHNLRGRGAVRSRKLLETAKATPTKLALTGTPMWSRPRDMWMLFNILFGYRFGNADEFDIAYCGAYWDRWGGKKNTGVTRPEELKLRMQYVMKRRLKREVAKELPPVIREVRWVPGTKRAKEKLRQAVASVGGNRMHDALEATLDDKLDVAVETAVDFGTPVVMFTWMKTHARLLQVKMEEAGMKTYLIDGDVPHKQRDILIAKAAEENATGKQVSLVCTIDSVKEGVDGLQFVTSNAVFHSLDYLPIKVAQTISRLDRIGQKEPVTAIFIAMRDSADQLVTQTVLDKLDQWLKLFGVDDNSKLTEAFKKTDEREMEQMILKQMYEEFK